MNQALRLPIRFYEPIEPALSPSPSTIIAKAADGSVLAEAVRYRISEDDAPAYREHFKNRWMIVEHNRERTLIRESTDSFSDPADARYWYWSGPEPIEWEAWISPLFSSGEIAA